MQTASQNETICFLGSSRAFGDCADCMEMVSTHISVVLLIGARALKLKRPVKLPYVDLSTPELRLAMCEHELMLNRRTAPDLYRAVHRITRERSGALALNGEGELVEAVLEMKRFDNNFLFDRLAERGRLTAGDMAELATVIARFHQAAAVCTDGDGAARMERVLTINEQAFALAKILPNDEVEPVIADCRAALARHAGLLDQRARGGRVRRGHGDLHLRNICSVDGRPLLFDCLEFDEDLATVDILYDLAFVLFACAHYYRATGEAAAIRLAEATMDGIESELTAPHGGYAEDDLGTLPRRQNPHMHLLEAFHALAEATGNQRWLDAAGRIVRLAAERFIDANGTLGEYFDTIWQPVAGAPGRLREPGHQFEWVWLLYHHRRLAGCETARALAEGLHRFGLAHG
ncbi:MAG: AGE family epimerase/isomerase, partial [Bosea sp.]|nr:AGE family epimerase/isomerase [Bosea sp. (in: a-proteobacteria)]